MNNNRRIGASNIVIEARGHEFVVNNLGGSICRKCGAWQTVPLTYDCPKVKKKVTK